MAVIVYSFACSLKVQILEQIGGDTNDICQDSLGNVSLQQLCTGLK